MARSDPTRWAGRSFFLLAVAEVDKAAVFTIRTVDRYTHWSVLAGLLPDQRHDLLIFFPLPQIIPDSDEHEPPGLRDLPMYSVYRISTFEQSSKTPRTPYSVQC